jgi:hypothetical protein
MNPSVLRGRGVGWAVAVALLLVLMTDLLASRAGAGTPLDITRVSSRNVTIPGGGLESAVATCPQGTRAISGGFQTIGTDASLFVPVSRQTNAGRAWLVLAENPGTGDGILRASAICTQVN